MNKRRLIILILLLVLAVAAGFVVLTNREPSSSPQGDLSLRITPILEKFAVSPAPATTGAPSPTGQPTASASLAPTATALPSPSPSASSSPTVSPTPSPSASPTPATSPSPSPTTAPSTQDASLKGLVIGVDPGHQAHDNDELEPVSPGSSDKKKKVSSGTYGRYTGTPEHEVNLNVALRLQALLEDAGATVIMTRTSADVDISNAERAQLFNRKKVDLGVRIHCNGSTDNSVTGAFMLVPKENPYKSDCEKAAKCILEAYGKATGISVSKGLTYRGDQTGFNWCERPIVNIEMGHMTNKAEDEKLSDKDFQKKMARGIFNGIVQYFN